MQLTWLMAIAQWPIDSSDLMETIGYGTPIPQQEN
jgi:hypothetical protein